MEEVDQADKARDAKTILTLDELTLHNSLESGVWVAISGQVYDISTFLSEHPGGEDILLEAAGTDVTEDFFDLHSDEAQEWLPAYHIGSLDLAPRPAKDLVTDQSQRRPFLRPDIWQQVTVLEKRQLSHNTILLTLKWNHCEEFGLPIGKHVLLRARDPVSGSSIVRAYTPIAARDGIGEVDLLIKIYPKTDGRAGGKMTTTLDSMPIGTTLELKGPVGRFEYLGKGKCHVSGNTRQVNRFILVSAGSGLTPMLQVLRAIAKDAEDSTECLLLYGNRHEEDILCRQELESMDALDGRRVRVIHTLSSPSASWSGQRGRLGRELLEAEVERPKPDVTDLVLLCGPSAMETAIKHVLQAGGWTDEQVVSF
ncbi:hypothetical protein CEP54_007289 [Fusarium duplospermum]|uniref:Cytochrome-b5 reductase n=1 Tax=Fusarium duplospermum TaxID=1325734 RepID=A0A428Q217_9HYPO|nr:hypothetical protein CEP54_007289 [Fusarium duplospermum]